MNNDQLTYRLKQIDELSYDIRLESILADFVLRGYLPDMDEITVCPLDTFTRGYEKDILDASHFTFSDFSSEDEPSIDWQNFYDSLPAGPYIAVSREGIYDTLPQALFHIPLKERENPGKWTESEQSRIKREEQFARKFFLPFEQKIFKQRVSWEVNEQAFLLGDWESLGLKDLITFWDLPDWLLSPYLNRLISVLPLVPHICGDLALTAFCMQTVIGHTIELTHIPAKSTQVPEELVSSLAGGILGGDTLLGSSLIDGAPNIAINVKNVPIDQAEDFLDGQHKGVKRRLLNLLCEYFLPIETDVEIRVELTKSGRGFELSPVSFSSVLGYTTIL